MRVCSRRFLHILVLFIFNSCSFQHQKGTEAASAVDVSKMSYEQVRVSVIDKYCTGCHSVAGGNSGGINLESYANVVADLSKINQACFVDHTMPKNGSLAPQDAALLHAWMQAGAPEMPGGAPAPENPGGSVGHSISGVDPSLLSYQNLNEQVFTPSCIECHSKKDNGEGDKGGVNLESYATVTKNLDRLFVAVFYEAKMPPKKPLSNTQLDLLAAWIAAGAPEEAPVLKSTFSSIEKIVISQKCIQCHNPKGKARHVPLTNYKDLINPNSTVIVPGHPEKSDLYIDISKAEDDEDRMPPPKASKRLSDDWIGKIKQWIDDGAPEN